MENKRTEIKFGDGCMLVSEILKYKTVEDFVKDKIGWVTWSEAPEEYLKSLYEIAHRDDNIATKANEVIAEKSDEIPPVVPVVKKTSTNKKAVTKKE